MDNLQDLLKSAEAFNAAFEALIGKTLFSQKLPHPPKFTILETKSDYFVGIWKGSSKDVQFFAQYNMKKVFSLAE